MAVVAFVEKGSNLGPTLAAAKAKRPEVAAQSVSVSVDEIVFIDSEHAAVLFRFQQMVVTSAQASW